MNSRRFVSAFIALSAALSTRAALAQPGTDPSPTAPPGAPSGATTAPAAASPTAPASGTVSSSTMSTASASTSTTPATPSAADEELERAGGEYRTLSGYRFITPIEAFTPFLNTSFRFAQGFGVVTFDVPSPISGESTAGTLFLYGQQLFGQIGINNRVSIDIRATGAAAVGGNLDTILGIGALANLEAGAMPKVRLFTLPSPALQVSLGTGVFYSRTIQIRPSALIGRAAGDVSSAESQLIVQAGTLNVVPALMAATAFGPLGLQTSVAPSFGVAGDRTPTGLNVGVHAGFDIHKLSRSVPLAIVAEYNLGAELSSGQDNVPAGDAINSIGGGLYYSGRRDFELGIVARTTTGTLQLTQGQLVMQYYF